MPVEKKKPAKREKPAKPERKAAVTKSVPQSVRAAAPEPPFRIVGVGASAGGLEAFEQFFSNMPPDSGMAIVIVQHLDPSRHSALPDILAASPPCPSTKRRRT